MLIKAYTTYMLLKAKIKHKAFDEQDEMIDETEECIEYMQECDEFFKIDIAFLRNETIEAIFELMKQKKRN